MENISRNIRQMLLFPVIMLGLLYLGVTSRAEEKPTVAYKTHVQNMDWQEERRDGELSGTQDLSLQAEAMTIRLENIAPGAGGISYRSHCQNEGWQSWVRDGAVTGTTGKAQRMEALEISLYGELAAKYNVAYRVWLQDLGWQDWRYNGATAGTTGESRRIEACEIRLEERTPGVNIQVSSHVQDIGWQPYVTPEAVSGTEGQSLRLEAVKLQLSGAAGTSYVEYRAHCQDVGWTGWSRNGVMSGTESRSLRMEALEVRLSPDLAAKYDVYYKVHVQDIGWLEWAANGQTAGTTGIARRLEAVQVKLTPKGKGPGTGRSYIGKPNLSYEAHVQNKGDMEFVNEGVACGTEGQSLRMESVRFSLSGGQMSGDVISRAHVQDDGWKNPVGSGTWAGTVGKSKRLEAIELRLTGELEQYFDIYYRAHIQNFGWLGWASNGQAAGSTGIGMRMEALQVCLVRKGEAAPGSTEGYYMDKLPGVKTGVYRIMVNKLMNVVTIYDGEVPIRACIASAGNPTPVGTFYTPAKFLWAPLIGGVWGQYSTQIYNGFLFHSVPYARTDPRTLSTTAYNLLGTTQSLGCVRLLVEDAKWIYDNCPIGTEVTIYSSTDPGPLGKPTAPPLAPGQTWDPTDPNI